MLHKPESHVRTVSVLVCLSSLGHRPSAPIATLLQMRPSDKPKAGPLISPSFAKAHIRTVPNTDGTAFSSAFYPEFRHPFRPIDTSPVPCCRLVESTVLSTR